MDAPGKKRKSRRGRRGRKASQNHHSETPEEEQTTVSTTPSQPPHPKRRRIDAASNSTNRPSFLDKMRVRLSGGHFRMLNEKLYTCSGNEAFNLFKNDPQLFDVYHAGYQEQMSHWPEQPVYIIIRWLKSRSSSLIVADFGCGNASLAKNVKNKVFSIDLVSSDPSVIACDMSHEAKRVLKPRGWLLIAEVQSRFDPGNGGADPDNFCEAINKLGFSLVSKDCANKMFLLFYFKKKEKISEVRNIEWPELKPCIYKRRRSISKFYCGKSKSFTSLSYVSSSSSTKDLAKPDNTYNRKRKNLLAFSIMQDRSQPNDPTSREGGISKRPAISSRCTSASSISRSSSGSNSNSSEEEQYPSRLLPPRHPCSKAAASVAAAPFDSSAPKKFSFPMRSFSLTDLEGVVGSSSSSITPTEKQLRGISS